MIVTYRDERVAAVRPADADGLAATADVVVADNRYPDFVMPICAAARRRAIPVVLDADRPTFEDDPLFAAATHLIFSSECLRETTGIADLAEGLSRIAAKTEAFLAVSNGPDDIVYLKNGKPAACRSSRCAPSIRSGPAMRFTAASLWRWPRDKSEIEAMRFAAAVAGIKCTRIGGGGGMPMRAEVEAFLAERAEAASVRAGAREIP